VSWASLVPRRGSDDIMLLAHNSEVDGSGDLYAVPWNGTAFDTSKELLLSSATTSSTEQHFVFSWEGTSDDGLVVYGESTLTYRTFSLTAPHWSTEATITTGAIDAVRMCSDSTSDYIGFIWQDSGTDVNVRMWDGTQILSSPPSEDAVTEANGANTVNVDCAWHNGGALFGFIDNNALSMDYFNFTKPNTWSTSDLTSTDNTGNFASDDIESLRFTKHPTTDEIMIVAMDRLEDISVIRWTGSAIATVTASPIEASTEVVNAAQEGVMFDWYRYDPVPSVTNINPSGINFVLGATVAL